jgi:hypothetical protein
MSLIYGDNFIGEDELANGGQFAYLFSDYNYGSSTLVVNAKNLILPAASLTPSCYTNMFYNCTNLTTAPELPATTLEEGCYSSMFAACYSLTTAPELPATTLVGWCYANMFEGSTSLTVAPELPATTLTEGCYAYMFEGCTSLNYIKCMATDITAESCTTEWVTDVASSGTFVKDASMSDWTIDINGIPTGWTVQTASS